MSMRIIFMGTPDFSVPTLKECLAHGYEVIAVYTQPPRPAGRGLEPQVSAVENAARQAGLPVFSPLSLKSEEEQQRFASLNADVAVVVAYGLILPRAILQAPRLGCLNIHASLLPRWRGAAPINRAIMAGDKETGVMVMQMDEGLDTGAVCLAERLPIAPNETAGELHDRLSRIGADVLIRALSALSRGSLSQTVQSSEGVTYARKIEKSECRINWDQSALQVHNHIRGLSPWPGAWFEINTGRGMERIKVRRSEVVEEQGELAPAGTLLDDSLQVTCKSGSIRLTEVQRAGRAPMSAQEVLRGLKLSAGMRVEI